MQSRTFWPAYGADLFGHLRLSFTISYRRMSDESAEVNSQLLTWNGYDFAKKEIA